MPNIPGIVGYIQPGAYTNVTTRQGALSLPGGPTITCILGQGYREEVLVERAAGGGKDGLPAQFDPRLQPTGRYFRLAKYPIVPGTLEVYLNPLFDGTDLPLIRIADNVVNGNLRQDTGAAWLAEFGAGGESNVVGTVADGYGGLPEGTTGGGGVRPDKGLYVDAGVLDERNYGLDAHQGTSANAGSFFQSPYGRRYGKWAARIKQGTAEPQHYYVDEKTGQLILDYPLARRDRLVVRYIAEVDVNEYEVFTDLKPLFDKHGFPAVQNTISLAAQMAAENGAPIIATIHAGLKYNAIENRWVRDPYWSDAFAELEKHNLYFIVPIAQGAIYDEVVMPSYDTVTLGALTGNGQYLQEDPASGDQPGINIYPLEVDANTGVPTLLQIFKNERALTFGIDYTVENASGPQPVLIRFSPAQYLVDGDRVTANYKPVIDLIATVQQVAKAHIDLMSDTPNRKERFLLTGGYEGYNFNKAVDSITGIDNNFGDSFRTMFFMPERIRRVVNGETAYLNAQYVAACAAGRFTSNEYLAEPLTRKTLIGFDIEAVLRYTDIQQRILGEAGAAVLEPLNSGARVVNGFSTVNTGNAVEEEPSVTRIRDYTAFVTRTILENRFVGKVILKETPGQLALVTDLVLRSLISQNLLTKYANVRAEVDKIEPRQINVSFDIQPVFPLNWIRIDFSIGVI